MKGSTGIQAFIQRWFVNRHYKSRLKVSLNLEGMIRKRFYKKMGYMPNLENPKTFNEKLQWFKLHVRDSRTTRCADKYAVREYVAEKIGEEYLVPLFGVYDSVEEINIDKLPEKFVLKPNHESGCVILCRDKKKIDWKKQADVMKNWLRENYYYQTGEWQYKNISPKILCEKMLNGDIIDYRFYCFRGKPVIVRITYDAAHTMRKANFDLNFRVIPDKNNQNRPDIWSLFERPENWEKMIEVAGILSKEFPFVRVDLYNVEGQIYFGELTFSPSDGMEFFWTKEWDKKLGDMYDIHAWSL